MNRPATSDRLPPLKPGKAQPVGLAVLKTVGDIITCSCNGWACRHRRRKVREDRAERHANSKHGGQVIWT